VGKWGRRQDQCSFVVGDVKMIGKWVGRKVIKKIKVHQDGFKGEKIYKKG